MKKMMLLALTLISVNAFSSEFPLPGKYIGRTKHGLRCSLNIKKIYTEFEDIKRLNKRDLDAGVFGEEDLPEYMMKVDVSLAMRDFIVSGDEHVNQVDQELADMGVAHRLSGGRGFLPLPWFSAVEVRIDKDRRPVNYHFVSLPLYRNSECLDLKLKE